METLKLRIAERLRELNQTERAISLLATGKPDAIRYIRARDHLPSYDRLAQIARAMDTTPDYLLGLADDPTIIARSLAATKDEKRRLIENYVFQRDKQNSDQQIPIYFVDRTELRIILNQAVEVSFVNKRHEADFIERSTFSAQVRERPLFAVATQNQMFGLGKTFLVDRNSRSSINDSIVVELLPTLSKADEELRFTPVVYGQLLRRSVTDIEIKTMPSGSVVRLPLADVLVLRILPLEELYVAGW